MFYLFLLILFSIFPIISATSVLVDLNPISDFISRMTIVNHNITESLESEFYNLSVRLEDEINKLYYVSEKCPICKENYIGEYFTRGPKFDNISAKIFCPKCGKIFLQKYYRILDLW